MYTDWTKHISDKDEKAAFEKEIRSSVEVLRRLKKLLEDKEATLERSELDPTAYNSPSWAYLQAHKNGYRSALNHLKQLCTLDPKDNK